MKCNNYCMWFLEIFSNYTVEPRQRITNWTTLNARVRSFNQACTLWSQNRDSRNLLHHVRTCCARTHARINPVYIGQRMPRFGRVTRWWIKK